MNETCSTQENPKNIKEYFRSWKFWKPAISVVSGGLVGFLYYYFIGCASGSCAITSSPYLSIIWGGLFGFVLVNRPCSSCK